MTLLSKHTVFCPKAYFMGHLVTLVATYSKDVGRGLGSTLQRTMAITTTSFDIESGHSTCKYLPSFRSMVDLNLNLAYHYK